MEHQLHAMSEMARVPSILARFLAVERPADQCWDWSGKVSSWGYGVVKVRLHSGRTIESGPHRVAYLVAVQSIPLGLDLDHLCRNRLCCNPSHLEPVTRRENTLRGDGPTAANARKTHCPRGHKLSGDNLIPANLRQGSRACLPCHRDRKRARRRAA